MTQKPQARKIGWGRRRRFAGWLLAALGAAVAGLWTVSGWYGFRFGTRNWQVAAEWGELALLESTDDGDLTMVVRDTSHAWAVGWWRWGWREHNPWLNEVSTGGPIWPFPIILWAGASLLLRSGVLARRYEAGNACVKCGYSLAGLTEGAPCPECGRLAV